MRQSEFTCSSCGSDDLRRSYSTSLTELPKMFRGVYPFRCMSCRERCWVSVWSLGDGKNPRCPRCLNIDVLPTATHRMRLRLWQRLLLALGAQAQRCAFCSYRFVSFKRGQTPPLSVQPPVPPVQLRQRTDLPTTQGDSPMAVAARVGK
jgi:hypothetical protein